MTTATPFQTAFRALVLACCFLACYQLLAISALGQTATATLSGTVEDENGALIPNAAVTAINTGTAMQRETTTDDRGNYVFVLLPPGTYIVRVQTQGFATVENSNVILNVGDQKSLQIQLKAGNISEMVKIEGDAPLINESPAVGTVVDRQFVENLPLNGRSFQSLISLTPGVVVTKTTFGEQGQFSVNGQRANSNYFTVDGVSANIGATPGTTAGQATGGTLPGFAANGGTSNLVSIDALQEFKVMTSTFAAEFGRTPGAQVQIVTRSGTNQFRGSLYNYFRNDVFDANDWFANSRGLPKPALRQNNFGGVIGGPLYLPRFGEGGPAFYNGKNKTFFFFSYEGLRLRLPQTGLISVPSVQTRQQAPASLQPYLNVFPVPNGRILTGGFAEFNATYSDPSTLNATSIRIDHAVNDRLTVFGRYNYSPSDTNQRRASLNTFSQISTKTQTLTFGAVQSLNAAVSNDFRANFSRNTGRSIDFIDNFGGGIPLSLSSLVPASIDSAESSFLFSAGGTSWSIGPFQADTQRQVNLVDTLSIVSGAHQLKFGVDYRRLSPIFDRVNYTQQVFFDNLSAILASRASSAFVTAFDGPRIPIFDNLSIFGQDTWRIAPRLTLTYGMRWELNPPPKDANGNDPLTVTGFDNLATLALAPAGTPLYKTSFGNFAPRVGVAYQLSQRPGRETMLRGGFGLFYDLGSGPAASAFGVSFPYRRLKPVPGSNGIPFPLDNVSAAPLPFSLAPPYSALSGIIDPNFNLPLTYQWNVAVEQSLGANQTISASYVAAIGRRLPRQESIPRVNLNPNFASILLTRSDATSDYHGLQMQYQRRLSRGLQTLASYTWSHSIDDVSSDSETETFISGSSATQRRGPSDFDVRHAFNAAVTYNIPAPFESGFANALTRNFSVDTIFTARTATPVNVRVVNFRSLRPDLVSGVPLYIEDSSFPGGRRINRAAFVAPPTIPGGIFRQGNLGRNALRGFGVWQMDFVVRRQFNLTERVNLQLRAEAFNIFNHPNFGDFGGPENTNALNSPRFGESTVMLGRSLGGGGVAGGFNPLYQVGGPRSMQFALKIGF